MSSYRIITDSTADLSQELVSELDVTVIPMKVTIDNQTYLDYPDKHELGAHEFYEKLREGKFATTTQINSSEFQDYFEPILKENQDILYIAFSSGLSGTYQSANLAKEELNEKYPQRKITIIDSQSASMGEGLLVYYAAKLQKQGKSLDEVANWAEENKHHLCHWFTVDDLNHLKRGGRISSTAALVGTVMGIKPILHVDDEGHLMPVGKVRGRRQSLNNLISHMENSAINPENQTIFIAHGDCLEDAEYVANCVREKFGISHIEINFVGPIIGTHTGPGVMTLFFLGNPK